MRRLLTWILFLLIVTGTYGQEHNLTLQFSKILFGDLADTVEKIIPFRIYYSERLIDSLSVSVNTENATVDQFFDSMLRRKGFSFIITDDDKIILSKGYPVKTSFREEYLGYLKRNSLKIDTTGYRKASTVQADSRESQDYRVFRIGKLSAGEKNTTAVLSGTVTVLADGKPVKGAVVYVEKLKAGATTNEAGFYSLALPKGQYQIEYRMIGMKTIRRNIVIYSDGLLDVEMSDTDNLLGTVYITASRDDIVRDVRTGIEKIDIKMLKQIPMGLGEADVIKSSLLLPGVQSVGEASGGFNVRGGNADQNLVLLDNAPIINTYHFFGFFSAFNSDMVKEITLYKSGVPSKYGGRLSSVMAITSLEGNREKVRVSGGISPLTGRILVEGPLSSGKGSFILGARTTYTDWVLTLFDDYRIRNSGADFHDLHGIITRSIDEKNTILLSGYYSNDKFNYFRETGFNYGNLSSTIKWNHKINPELSVSFSGIITSYRYKVDTFRDSTEYSSLSYNLYQKILRADFIFKPGEKHNIEFGMDADWYSLSPGTREPFGDYSAVIAKKLQRERALEPSLYLSDEYELSPRFLLSGGIRGTLYTSFGPGTGFKYNNEISRSPESITDTVRYMNGEVIDFYPRLEFRFSSRLIISPETSLKLGIQRIYQYLNMISNTTSISPTDIWTLCNNYNEPGRSDQVSFGLYKTSRIKTYETSVEAYYKILSNIIDYKGGAALLMNEHIETDILNSSGKAYGVELMVKKQTGSLTGWVSYTYSRALLKTNSNFEEEKVNGGNYYPADFDKPHDFKFIANLKISRRINVTSNFVYNTGRPITYPVAFYDFNGTSNLYYSPRNSYRLPDYIRLDMAATINGNLKARKLNHSSLTLTVYNVLNRHNPYSVYFRNENGTINGYRLVIFGRPVIMVTYNFRIFGNATGDF